MRLFTLAFIIALLMVSTVAVAHGAEGRRTAFFGGLAVGLVGGFLVRDAMEVRPAPQVVYVEQQPRIVYVEQRPTVYVEAQFVYESRPSRVVYVNSDRGCGHVVRGWQPPVAHPFPQ